MERSPDLRRYVLGRLAEFGSHVRVGFEENRSHLENKRGLTTDDRIEYAHLLARCTSQTRLARRRAFEGRQRCHPIAHINHDQRSATRDWIIDAHLLVIFTTSNPRLTRRRIHERR